MYSAIAANKRKTVIIMALFLLLVGGLIYLLDKIYGRGSPTIFIGGVIGSLIYVVASYYGGSKMALAVNGAREIQKRDNPRLYRTVENLSITDGLPMPRVYIMDDPAPNAFATGRDPAHSVVCATTGLLDIMTDSELEAVIAHEMGHVKNYDIRVSLVAFALTSIISLLADFMIRISWFGGNDRDNNNSGAGLMFLLGIVAAIISPLVATMIQLAISRQREYLADATSALTTRYPEALISALQKLEQVSTATSRQNTATAHLFFANPLKGHSLAALFSTHPPIPDRIARLQSMEGKV